MKTEVISTLANYFKEDGKKVLLVCPGSKARDELIKRCDTRFGIKVSKKVGDNCACLITQGLMNQKILKTQEGRDKYIEALSKYDVCLVDEVEYTINPGGEFIYENLINTQTLYGFSGTADKWTGTMIGFSEGLSEQVLKNKDLIKYFGPAIIFRMPLNMKIDDIQIKTKAMDFLKLDHKAIDEASSIYNEVMNQIWKDPGIIEVLIKTIKHFPKAFIPINNLNSILVDWIDNYFIGELRILLVCGEGYIYYDLDGNKTKLTLQEACDYIAQGKVDVIPSTSSGFRALDFPGLESIILISGAVAGVVLQCIGGNLPKFIKFGKSEYKNKLSKKA